MFKPALSCTDYTDESIPYSVVNSPKAYPHLRLAFAVLDRAIRDAIQEKSSVCVKQTKQLRRQALTWMFTDHVRPDNDSRYTFLEICEWLDCDPKVIRNFVLNSRLAPGPSGKTLAYGSVDDLFHAILIDR